MVKYKIIDGFNGYRVGTDGSVWSCIKRKRRTGSIGGTYTFLGDKWEKMKVTKTWQGRACVGLYPGNKFKLVHRLVLEAFIGKCPKGMEACHYPDKNPMNNNLHNLKWGTKKENHAHAVIHKTKGYGQYSARRKLTIKQVKFIRSSYPTRTMVSLAKQFKVSFTCIWSIIHNRSWTTEQHK